MSGRRTTIDYILTFSSEFAVMVAGLLVYKLAASYLPENGFTDYSLSRRTISFIQPLLILGLGVGIPRYVAFSEARNSERHSGSYFVAGMLIVLIVAVPFLLLLVGAKTFFSELLFDTAKFADVMPQIALMLLGLIFHSVVYSYYRGKVKMIHANILQIVNLGIVPLAAFAGGNSLSSVLLFTGAGWTLIPVLFMVHVFVQLEWKVSELKSCTKELLVYGLQRVPGDTALAGFLALPAFFTAHLVDDNLVTAGYVAFSMSMLGLAGAAFGPICLLLLPSASKIIVAKDFRLLNALTNKVAVWTLGLTTAGIAFVLLFAEPVLDLYLGSSSPELLLCLRIIILSAIGYTIYISLRSILDAYYIRAVNTLNIFIAFVLFVICAVVVVTMSLNYIWLLICFNVCMLILGLLTARETYRIFKREL
jgi:O-antigen/teichoic acid export membrane protein